MVRKNAIRLLLVPVAMGLAACRHDAGPDAAGAIRFASPALTRVAVENADDLETLGGAFTVWGRYAATAGGGAYSEVFGGGRKVSCGSAGWDYEGGYEYWYSGNTYDFYALCPSADQLREGDITASGDKDGNIAVQNFDARKGIDLMRAEQTVSVREGIWPGRVAFSFRHLTARVEFVGKLDPASVEMIKDFRVEVTGARLYGIPFGGTYEAADWAPGTTTDADNPFSSYTVPDGGTGIVLDKNGTSVIGANEAGKACLPLPGRLGDGACFAVDYVVKSAGDDAGVKHTEVIPLASLGVTEWEPGRSYRYAFTVADGDHILFSPPAVEAWQDATGGIIVVE